jgi:uncharacterized membrane protein SirB2
MHGVYSDYAVTVPTDWLVWLATSAARLAVYRMQGLHGPIRLVHLLGTAAFFGGILLLDLRLLGWLGREVAVDALSRVVLPVVHVAFGAVFLTGLWLFLYDPIQTGSHTWFVPKLLLIVLGLANAAVFSQPRTRGLRAVGTGALTRHARLAGALSILLWGGVIACATGNQEERPMVRGRGVSLPTITTGETR